MPHIRLLPNDAGARLTRQSLRLVQPGILPSHCQAGEVATEPDDGASTRAELQGMMSRNWQCECASHTGVPGSIVILNAVQNRFALRPEVGIERHPHPRAAGNSLDGIRETACPSVRAHQRLGRTLSSY
jgi:hypothetical protein